MMKTAKITLTLITALALAACGNSASKQPKSQSEALPYSPDSVREQVVMDFGRRTVRIQPDSSLSRPAMMKSRDNCFIVMSKKDYYLYVYEPQGRDTVLLARYDCAFAQRKGQKEQSGDMRTPHCTLSDPFTIEQIQSSGGWVHDFGDGRGAILSYGPYFLRLRTPGHTGIGIHGSTGNRQTVPGRASEGCIRLRDEDIADLATHYAHVGMPVVIKAEEVDDYPFEIHAMKRQHIARLRHLNPALTLSNRQIERAKAKDGRLKGEPQGYGEASGPAARKGGITLQELRAGNH